MSKDAVARWLWMFALMTGMPAVPDSLLEYFADQMVHFIEDACEGDWSARIITTVDCSF